MNATDSQRLFYPRTDTPGAVHHELHLELTVTHRQAIEVAEELISYVKDNEPGTLTYEWYKTVDEAGAVRLTVFEKCVGRACIFFSLSFLFLLFLETFFNEILHGAPGANVRTGTRVRRHSTPMPEAQYLPRPSEK